jgi:hypothetical protein
VAETIANIHKMENASDTFKGLKKNSRFGQMAPVYQAVSIPEKGSDI